MKKVYTQLNLLNNELHNLTIENSSVQPTLEGYFNGKNNGSIAYFSDGKLCYGYGKTSTEALSVHTIATESWVEDQINGIITTNGLQDVAIGNLQSDVSTLMGWGNHNDAGYLTTKDAQIIYVSNTIFQKILEPIAINADNGNTAYGWGNHASEGYLKSSGVTAATKCKITYNSNGLVTAGADLAASDIPNLDASKITSGTFADARIASAEKWNAKQNAISDLSTIRDNAELGAEAYGWGNHASVGYDAVVPFVEVPNVGDLGASVSISSAPSTVTSDHVLVFSTNKGFIYRKLTVQSGAASVTYYNVKKTTQFGGETMESLHTYGKCISINGSIYKFFGGKWAAQATWVLVHKGTSKELNNDVNTLKSDVSALKAYFDGQNDADNALNKWHEIVNFLDSFTESDKLLERIQGIEGDVSTLSNNYSYLSTSNAGKLSYGNVSVNGAKLNSDSLSFYAPTDAPATGGMMLESVAVSGGGYSVGYKKYKYATNVNATASTSVYNVQTDIDGTDVIVKCYVKNGTSWEEVIVDVSVSAVNNKAKVTLTLNVTATTQFRVVVIG